MDTQNVGDSSKKSPSVTLTLHSHRHLPLDDQPSLIQPVDPMAWGMKNQWVEHDALFSISESGELAFWVPEEGNVGVNGHKGASTSDDSGWRCTGRVKTGRKGIRKAKCSSAKKTALSEFFYALYRCSLNVVSQSPPAQMVKKSSPSGTQKSLNSHRDWNFAERIGQGLFE